MNEIQFALVKAAEECTELAKELLKAAQYGHETFNHKHNEFTLDMINDEYNDVLGCIAHLNNVGVKIRHDADKVSARVDKIYKNMSAARAEGSLV